MQLCNQWRASSRRWYSWAMSLYKAGIWWDIRQIYGGNPLEMWISPFPGLWQLSRAGSADEAVAF